MSAMEKKEGKKNIFSPIAKFFREIKSELKKVVFPTAKQTRINTTVVIVAVVVVGILIGLLDFVFVTARNFVINYGEEPATQAPVEATQDVAPELTPAQQAQMVLDELDSYTYDEAGNAVDENGEIIVQDDGNGNTVEQSAPDGGVREDDLVVNQRKALGDHAPAGHSGDLSGVGERLCHQVQHGNQNHQQHKHHDQVDCCGGELGCADDFLVAVHITRPPFR